jgi:hypothetical protein
MKQVAESEVLNRLRTVLTAKGQKLVVGHAIGPASGRPKCLLIDAATGARRPAGDLARLARDTGVLAEDEEMIPTSR